MSENYWWRETRTVTRFNQASRGEYGEEPLARGDFRYTVTESTNFADISASERVNELKSIGFHVELVSSRDVFALELRRARTGEYFKLFFNDLNDLISWTSKGGAKPRRVLRQYGAANLDVSEPTEVQRALSTIEDPPEKKEEAAASHAEFRRRVEF